MSKPRARASSLISIITTGIPTLAKFIAIPPPMVPPPKIPTLLMVRSTVSFAKSLTFAAARSAKKMCRIADDCVDCTHSVNNSRSLTIPAETLEVTAICTASIIFCGASWPRDFFAIFFRQLSKRASVAVAGSIVISLTRLQGALSAISVSA